MRSRSAYAPAATRTIATKRYASVSPRASTSAATEVITNTAIACESDANRFAFDSCPRERKRKKYGMSMTTSGQMSSPAIHSEAAIPFISR